MKKSDSSIIIKGIGVYKPNQRLTNKKLAKIVDTTDEWITERTGIKERRIAKNETTSYMAAQAVCQALECAQVKEDQVDLLLVCTMSPDLQYPSVACLIQNQLGLRPIMSFDLEAACAGFLYGLEVASKMMIAGEYKNVLVVGAEKMSSLVDWEDRSTCILFGDGAGAVLLQKSDKPGVGILGSIMRADGSHAKLLYQPAGGSALPITAETLKERKNYLKMEGKGIFKHAVLLMESVVRDILNKHGLSMGDINHVIPHQANIRIINSLAEKLGISLEKFIVNLDKMGNTSAASIPLALNEAFQQNRIKSGDLILLVAMGAGLTWGASLIRWQ